LKFAKAIKKYQHLYIIKIYSMLILMIFTIHTNININILYIYLTKKIGESSISVLHTSDRFDGPRG
jgi:hypothetical protein